MKNTFGTLFRATTWGESHGKAVGVVIDGCPSGLPLCVEDLQVELERRAPGKSPYTSPRKENDSPEIYSGVFEGVTTGAPISIFIPNQDADSSKYEPLKELLRPGHANFTYLQKYGIFDHRGSGRASARETAARVAAGAIAKKFIAQFGMVPQSQVIEIHGETTDENMIKAIEKAMEEGDSVGGVIGVTVPNMLVGLGEPLFDKLPALLAHAMLSIPAVKGFEIGSGFEAARKRGSENNDLFCIEEGEVKTKTNQSGGTLGGLSNGMPLTFRVAFKPPSSIKKRQETLRADGEVAQLTLPEGSRHDPCVIFRALPIVEAMCALVLADLVLLNQVARNETFHPNVCHA